MMNRPPKLPLNLKGYKRIQAKPIAPGEMLKFLREGQGFTQSELAARSGVSQNTLSSIERGRTSLGLERSKRLGEALGVHPATLAYSDYVAKGA